MTWFYIVYLLYQCVPNWLFSTPYDLIFALCTQMTPFKTIWPNFINVYPIDSFKHHMNGILHVYPNDPIDSFQDHLTWFLHCVPNWLLSRPYDLTFVLCTQLTPFKTILPNFINVYPIDSFQHHMNGILHCVPTLPIDSFQDHVTRFLHSIPNWLLSRQYDLIFVLCTQLNSFQDHLTQFYQCVVCLLYQCVTNWLFSIPYDLIFALFTQMTPLKTIWPNFINVYPIDSLQDHMTWFLHCVPAFINVYPIDSFQHYMIWFLDCVHNWLLSRPFDLTLSMCTQLTPFKTIWMEFYIVYPIYPIDSFQDHLTWFLHSIAKLTPFKTIWPDFCIVYPIDSFPDHLT